MKAKAFQAGARRSTSDAFALMPRYKLLIEYDGAPF